MKKLSTILIAVLLMPLGLAFGTAGKETKPQSVTIRFSWWGGDARHNATLDAMNLYMARNPNVKIEGEYQGYDGYFEKLSTQLAGGTEPDLIQVGQMSLLEYAGKFVDLYTKKGILDTGGFDANMLKWECVVNGKLLGLPTGLNGLTLIYNKDLLGKAGIPVDTKWDWKSLLDYGAKLHRLDGKYYLLGYDTEQLVNLLNLYIRQLIGGQWINDDYTIGFTRDALVSTLRYEKTLFDNNVLQPYAESVLFENKLNENPKLINGEFALILADASVIQSFKSSIKFNLGVTCPPLASNAKDSGIAVQPAQVLAVSANSKNIDATVRFLNWFLNGDDAIMALTTVRGMQPTVNGRKLLASAGKADPDISKAIDIDVQHVGAPPNVISGNEQLFSVQKDMVQKVGYGTATPEAAADELIAKYGEILKELKAQAPK